MHRREKIGLVLLCLLVCAIGALVQRWLSLRRNARDPAELYGPVWEQIAAVRAADYSRAYAHASSGFQEKVGAAAFDELILAEQPEVQRAIRVEFGRVRFEGRVARVLVYLILPDGEVVPAVYRLIHEGERWKIDAARVQRRGSQTRLGGGRA